MSVSFPAVVTAARVQPSKPAAQSRQKRRGRARQSAAERLTQSAYPVSTAARRLTAGPSPTRATSGYGMG